MKNERNAGRKPRISQEHIAEIRERISQGESVQIIAEEYGITRQALYSRLKNEHEPLCIDYVIEGRCCTRIEVNVKKESVHIINYAEKLSERAFGINEKPKWNDFIHFLEEQYIKNCCDFDDVNEVLICEDVKHHKVNLYEIIEDNDCLQMKSDMNDVNIKIPVFEFDRSNIFYTRTDTDGFQLKAISSDKRYFIKSQAVIAGVHMNDWAVEVIAADICRQLNIPCVNQRSCQFVYGKRVYMGVYSKNFELDGSTFISFESLLERRGLSTISDEFIQLKSIDKLKWCANKLSELGELEYSDALRYMLDLAVVDCLVGNVDRHTRNFGLFYDANSHTYEIPLIFDNGMGLFEHDAYRGRYKSFEEAMMNVYVAPYGEDPFEFMDMLDAEFNMSSIYPELSELTYHTVWSSPFAREYMRRMERRWRKSD